jgi:hypothetical protein
MDEDESVSLGLLRWRRPAFLLAPLSLLFAAGLPAALTAYAAEEVGLADPVLSGAAAGGLTFLIILSAILLCSGKGFNFPLLISTALSIGHGALFIAGGLAFALPGAQAALGRLGTLLPGEAAAIAASPAAVAGLAYAGSFLLVTASTAFALIVLRSIGLKRHLPEAQRLLAEEVAEG